MTSRAYGIAAIAFLCALMFAWGGNVGTSGADCYMMGAQAEREQVTIHNYEQKGCSR